MLEVQKTSSSSFSSPTNTMTAAPSATAGAAGPSAPPSISANGPQHQHHDSGAGAAAPYDPMASITATAGSSSSSSNNHNTAPTTINGVASHHYNNSNGQNGSAAFGSQLRPPIFRPGSASALPPPTRESVLQRLSEALLRRSLAKIDLCQKGLTPLDARLVKMALLQNRQLRVLKLGYNHLGDDGLQTLAAGISQHAQLQSLDLGFNNIGDVGCQALAQAMATSTICQLSTLYLAGNCIGQDGAMALADVIRRDGGSSLRRLYVTGNRLGPEGVMALTEAILEEAAANSKREISNDDDKYGESTTTTTTDAAMDTANTTTTTTATPAGDGAPAPSSTAPGMQELFLGGTGLGAAGCQAVARLLASPDCRLKVLSLANCDISDDEITRQDFGLATSIKGNRDCLPLASLQLSFNNISHKGLEALMNALWGSKTLKELRLDNNDIGDRGAQQLAAILPYIKTLETLDVGFNNINNKNQGMKILMKAVAETNNLTTLSLSGNPMQDVSSAKAVAFALAYNISLQSLLLVHCQLTTEGQRHVAAGAVSNSRTSLRELSGFPVGPVIVTLGFPDALEHWTNEQVLNFIHLMWNKSKAENENGKEEGEEKGFDPLNFLPASLSPSADKAARRSGPLEATIVVDVARKAFARLVANGDDVFSRRPGHPSGQASPAVLAPRDAIMLESVDGDSIVESMGEVAVSSSPSPSSMNLMELVEADVVPSNGNGTSSTSTSPTPMSSARKQARSFVAPPQERDADKQNQLPDPSRKKRIVEWLCSNIKHLNKLSQMPFDSGELLKLHQHYFTPVVNESGGTSAFRHDNNSSSSNNKNAGTASESARQSSSVPNVSRDSSNVHHFEDSSSQSLASSTGLQSGDVNMMVRASDPMFAAGSGGQLQHAPHQGGDAQEQSGPQPPVASSFPMLKRKVSYRFLGDASMHHQQQPLLPPSNSSPWGGLGGGGSSHLGSVAKMIQDGPAGHHSLPPKNKKARRNRTRISFLPRIKTKLDSYLDVCHEKALATMRQLYYVEQAILNGRVNPLVDESNARPLHLSGALAMDAETIVVDMI